MKTLKAFLSFLLCFYFLLNSAFSQIQPAGSKFSVSIYNGGNWRTYNYGLADLNYNFGFQGERKLNTKLSFVIDAGFDFKHFKEVKSITENYSTSSSTKLVMCKFTAGINYYIPIQKNGKVFLNANIGDYIERFLYPSTGNITDLTNPVDEKWNNRFGISAGVGFENELYKKLNWIFHFKYHYIFNRNVELSNPEIYEKNWDMKFLNINLGLKYNF